MSVIVWLAPGIERQSLDQRCRTWISLRLDRPSDLLRRVDTRGGSEGRIEVLPGDIATPTLVDRNTLIDAYALNG
jgi:hypothetical protein